MQITLPTTQLMATFQPTANLPECELPAIHLNGTGRETLVQEFKEAHAKLNEFVNAMAKVTCNGRDYYPLGDEAYGDARRTRDALFSLCDEIGAYLDDHLAHLSR